MAILYNPEEENPPSTPHTIEKFIHAVGQLGLYWLVLNEPPQTTALPSSVVTHSHVLPSMS